MSMKKISPFTNFEAVELSATVASTGTAENDAGSLGHKGYAALD